MSTKTEAQRIAAKLTDRQLIALVAQGDSPAALGELYLRHHKRVAITVRADFELSERDAEDIVQETFKRVQLKAAQYRPTGKVISWILRIAKNIVIDSARSHLRRRRRETSYTVAYPVPGVEAQAPEAVAWEYGDAAKAVGGVCGKLSDGERLGPFPVWRNGTRDRLRLWRNGAGEDSVRGMMRCYGMVPPKDED